MEITLQALLEGKPTVINNTEFLPTKEYVLPFINALKKFTNNFIVNVEIPKQLTISGDTKDITYNKVWVQAVLPSKGGESYSEVYGFVYALDVRTPHYKIYRGYLNSDNILCAFNNEWIIAEELNPSKAPEINISNLMSMTSDFPSRIRSMNNKFLPRDERHDNLGNLIDKSILYEYKGIGGKVKISASDIIKAFSLVYHDTTSKYYTKDTQESSLLNFYLALCSQISESKDIINRWEKTILMGLILNL